LRTKLSEAVIELALDVVLLALSMLFVVFAFIVKHYDQAHVADHIRLTQALLEATKYASCRIRHPRVMANMLRY